MAGSSNKRVGDYELLNHIGDGAQGKIFKSRCVVDTNDNVAKGEIVALKIIRRFGDDGKSEDRFKREVRNFLTLSHPNIVDYRESFVVQDEWGEDINCLVMEFLDGEDLKDRLAKHPKGLPWEFVKDLFEQCLAGLAYAGENGIIHRDIKPANIFLLVDGRVKIIDFGIAKKEDGTVTTTAGFKGTYDYMSPDFLTTGEDFRGDEVSDVFSIGVCFCQSLTGRLPYPSSRESGWVAYLNRWQKGDARDISISGGALRVLNDRAMAMVRKCMRVDRSKRYASFVDMLTDLKKIERKSVETTKHQYVFESYMGKGGFGEVFKAKRVEDGKFFAVKHMFPSLDPERFRREARLLQKYPHPNMVAYEGFVKIDRLDGADYYLILEFLDGMPSWGLRGRIKKEGALDVTEVVHLFCSYLTALEFLHTVHRKPILHRDVTPANLYAPPYDPQHPNECVPKIFDMGIARSEQTQTGGHVPGNPEYMAPEFVIESDFRGAPSSDLYCLGICLFESLTGKCAYPRLSRQTAEMWQTLRKRAEGHFNVNFDYQVFKDYPMLKQIVVKAIERDRRKRFSSAEEMRKAIESVGRGGEIVELDMGDITGEDDSLSPTIFVPDEAYLAAAASGQKTRRLIRLKRVLAMSAMLVMVAAVGVGGRMLWEKSTGGSRETAGSMQSPPPLPDFRPSSGYVALLRKRLVRAEDMKRKAPDNFQVLNRADELALLWSTTPGKFDRAFIEKLDAGNIEKAKEILRQWRAAEDSVPYGNLTEVVHDRVILSMESRLKFLVERIQMETLTPALSEKYVGKLDICITAARDKRATESLTNARRWWQKQQKILGGYAVRLVPIFSADFQSAVDKGDLATAEALVVEWAGILKTGGVGASISRNARDKAADDASEVFAELLQEKRKQILAACAQGDIVEARRMSEWFVACGKKTPSLIHVVAGEYSKMLREIALAQSVCVTKQIGAVSSKTTMTEMKAIIDLRTAWQKGWTEKQRTETASAIIGKGGELTTDYSRRAITAYKADRFSEGDDAYLQLQAFDKYIPAEFKPPDLRNKLAAVAELRDQLTKRAADFRKASDELDKLVLACGKQDPAAWKKAISKWSSLKIPDATRKTIFEGRKWKELKTSFAATINQYVARTTKKSAFKSVRAVLSMQGAGQIFTGNNKKSLEGMIALKERVINDREKLTEIIGSIKSGKPQTWARAMMDLAVCRTMPSLSYDKKTWDLWKQAETSCLLNMKKHLEQGGSASAREKHLQEIDAILKPTKAAKVFDPKQIALLEALVAQGVGELAQKKRAVFLAQRERARIEREQKESEVKTKEDRKRAIEQARLSAGRKKAEDERKQKEREQIIARKKEVAKEEAARLEKIQADLKKAEGIKKAMLQARLVIERKKIKARQKREKQARLAAERKNKEDSRLAKQEIERQKEAAAKKAAAEKAAAAERRTAEAERNRKEPEIVVVGNKGPVAQLDMSDELRALLDPIEAHLRGSDPRSALKLIRSDLVKRCRRLDKKNKVNWIALRSWIELMREEYP
ncbi:MAG: protein kinase, partial [Kiritimatiellae bacterium]|nr:protein kinase [Kiritimatiellia bacterium]